jgi:hypothetical protein
MEPGFVPQQLQILTWGEKLLIQLLAPTKNFFFLASGSMAFSGNYLAFQQDIAGWVASLPRSVSELDVVFLRSRKFQGKPLGSVPEEKVADLCVRRLAVLHALQWLRLHNRFYANVRIREDTVADLPDDGIPPAWENLVRYSTEDAASGCSSRQVLPEMLSLWLSAAEDDECNDAGLRRLRRTSRLPIARALLCAAREGGQLQPPGTRQSGDCTPGALADHLFQRVLHRAHCHDSHDAPETGEENNAHPPDEGVPIDALAIFLAEVLERHELSSAAVAAEIETVVSTGQPCGTFIVGTTLASDDREAMHREIRLRVPLAPVSCPPGGPAPALSTNAPPGTAANPLAPPTRGTPMPELRTEGFFAMMAPWLFPEGSGDLIDLRRPHQPLSPNITVEYLRRWYLHLAGHPSNRFTQDVRFSGCVLNLLNRMEAYKRSIAFVSATEYGKSADLWTVRGVKEELKRKGSDLHTKITGFASSIPNSRGFWTYERGRLKDMIAQKRRDTGRLPAFFFTFSLAPSSSVSLHKLLQKSNGSFALDTFSMNLSAGVRERMSRVLASPFHVAWYWQQFAKHLVLDVLVPAMSLSAYWYRHEWAAAPHIHGLAWTDESAPNPDVSEALEANVDAVALARRIVDFFDRYVTAQCPSRDSDGALSAGFLLTKEERRRRRLAQATDPVTVDAPIEHLAWLTEETRHTRHDACARPIPEKLRDKLPERLLVRPGFYCKNRYNKAVRPLDWVVPDPLQPSMLVCEMARNDGQTHHESYPLSRSTNANSCIDPVIAYHSLDRYLSTYTSKSGSIPQRTQRLFGQALERIADDGAPLLRGVRACMVALVGEMELHSYCVLHILGGWKLVHSSQQNRSCYVDGRRQVKPSLQGEDDSESLLFDNAMDIYEQRACLAHAFPADVQAGIRNLSRFDFDRYFTVFGRGANRRLQLRRECKRLSSAVLRADQYGRLPGPAITAVRPFPKPIEGTPGFAVFCESLLRAYQPYEGRWQAPTDIAEAAKTFMEDAACPFWALDYFLSCKEQKPCVDASAAPAPVRYVFDDEESKSDGEDEPLPGVGKLKRAMRQPMEWEDEPDCNMFEGGDMERDFVARDVFENPESFPYAATMENVDLTALAANEGKKGQLLPLEACIAQFHGELLSAEPGAICCDPGLSLQKLQASPEQYDWATSLLEDLNRCHPSTGQRTQCKRLLVGGGGVGRSTTLRTALQEYMLGLMAPEAAASLRRLGLSAPLLGCEIIAASAPSGTAACVMQLAASTTFTLLGLTPKNLKEQSIENKDTAARVRKRFLRQREDGSMERIVHLLVIDEVFMMDRAFLYFSKLAFDGYCAATNHGADSL